MTRRRFVVNVLLEAAALAVAIIYFASFIYLLDDILFS